MPSLNIIILIMTMIISLTFSFSFVEGSLKSNVLKEFTDQNDFNGTKWAVLIAGSFLYMNYRHQADICHAYHVLKEGGLKDENIIVFMFDDIAHNEANPRPGVIINRPKGENVYLGVPKDYTGLNMNKTNIFAAILGNKDDIKGGSGKMLKTGPNDHIFLYYADHGGPGILGMLDTYVYANELIDVLKKKHASNSYARMVVYVDACESGSMFDGMLPNNMSIYVTTSANPDENSYACYCDGPDHPKEYGDLCLGDTFSVSWMEDSEKVARNESLEQQYVTVKTRASGNGTWGHETSHVMQYGDIGISNDTLGFYIGSNSTNKTRISALDTTTPLNVIDQRDADLFYLRGKVERAEKGSKERVVAQKQLDEEISHRKHVDQSFASIGRVLFGDVNSLVRLNTVRPAGQPLVDDWDCFKSMVETYEEHCGPLGNYGRKYLRIFANMCNAGSQPGRMAQAASRVCPV